MPQDGRRSVGYRPFVTCDDPKGVVECGTIRKSNKSNFQKMEPSSEIRLIKPKSSSRALRREELGRASFQLLEVSKGAQKLNHMIESWSKGITAEGQPKEIAKDLLKGALDLQESLMMLGKLQAASKYVARLKQKQEKSEYSGLPGDLNLCQEIGFQRQEISLGDDPSRKKIEELREAIRVGLAKQKQLEERKFLSRLEITPTSSSQSSSVNHDEKIDLGPEKKTRGPNLIAKLMGLEEISSRPVQRKLQDEKIQQHKPEFNVNVPKLKKPEPEVLADEPDRRTLKEILEAMQCKGLLRSNSIRKAPVFHADDAPPIVLIKPSREPRPESGGMLEAKGAITAIKDIKIVKANEKFLARRIDKEEASSDLERMHEKPKPKDFPHVASCERGGSTLPKEKVTTQQRGQNADRDHNKSRHPSPPAKEWITKERHEPKSGETGKATKSSRRSPEKANSKAKSTQRSEDLVKTNAPVAAKPEDRPNHTKREVSPQRSRNSKQDQSKKEAWSRDSKQDQTKKEASPPVVHRSKKTVSNQRTQMSSQTSGVRKRIVRGQPPANEPKELPAAKLDKNDVAQMEDDMKIDTTCRNDHDNIETSPDNEETQFTEDNPDASESGVAVSETGISVENSPIVISPTTTELGAETTQQKLLEGSEIGDHVKSVLLSSPSFLSHAEDVFGFIPDSPALLQKPPSAVSMSPNEKLLIDYANEFIDCRTDEHGLANSVLVIGLGSLRTHNSLDNLLEELLKGIENLGNYCKLASESLLMDGVYTKLQRDLYFHRGGAVSKLWDAGWTRGFCLQDAEHVVKEVEETVLSSMIEETVIELVL